MGFVPTNDDSDAPFLRPEIVSLEEVLAKSLLAAAAM